METPASCEFESYLRLAIEPITTSCHESHQNLAREVIVVEDALNTEGAEPGVIDYTRNFADTLDP